MKDGNPEAVLPCLIQNKHNTEMDLKCTASIDHWQIVSCAFVFFPWLHFVVNTMLVSLLLFQFLLFFSTLGPLPS